MNQDRKKRDNCSRTGEQRQCFRVGNLNRNVLRVMRRTSAVLTNDAGIKRCSGAIKRLLFVARVVPWRYVCVRVYARTCVENLAAQTWWNIGTKMISRMKEREKYQVTQLLSCDASPFRAANKWKCNNISNLSKKWKRRGCAVTSRHREQNDIVVTREQMDDTKCPSWNSSANGRMVCSKWARNEVTWR